MAARKTDAGTDWSGLDEETQARAGGCAVGRMLAALPADARPLVEGVVMDRGRPAAGVAKALRKRLGDAAPGHYSIRNHRAKSCKCGEAS